MEVVAEGEAPKVEAAPKMVSFLGGCAGGSTFSSTAAWGGSSAGGVSVFASGSFSWTGGSWAAGGVVTSETSGGGVETALSRKLVTSSTASTGSSSIFSSTLASSTTSFFSSVTSFFMTSSRLGSAAGSVEVPNRFLAAPVDAVVVGGAENSENAGFSSGAFLSEARVKVNEDF